MAVYSVKVNGREFLIVVAEQCGDGWIPAAEPEATAAIKALQHGDGNERKRIDGGS
jgi:hypothetical protein